MFDKFYFGVIIVCLLCGISSFVAADEALLDGFEETTWEDPNWALCISDVILQEIYTDCSDYDRVFDPCCNSSRYFKILPCALIGRAFDMDEFGPVSDSEPPTFDSLYVREGYEFQLYSNNVWPDDPCDLEPVGEFMKGPQYVSLTHWVCDVFPKYFEPGTFFVSGGQGWLSNYSIEVFPNPLRLSVSHNADPCGLEPNDVITYQICYDSILRRLSDPCDPNSDCIAQSATDVQVVLGLPYSLEFESESNDPNWSYSLFYGTATWPIGTVDYGQSDCFDLVMRAGYCIVPGGKVTITCRIDYTVGSQEYSNEIEIDADVADCCHGSSIIYVDASATGCANGSSWSGAYTDLQSALDQARICDEVDEI